MNKALEFFSRIPKTHNCAQSTAAGFGREDLLDELSSKGAGKAPNGLCGALYAALLMTPEDVHEKIRSDFAAAAGALKCREIKQRGFPCSKCVETAAAAIEKYGGKKQK